MTVAQIARRMGLSRQGVQRIVNDLVALDMIQLLPNQDHKRAPLVVLSRKGRDAISEVNVVQAQWVNEIAEGLSERSLAQSLKSLQKIRESTDRA